jgi:hypothetical protein
MEGGLFFSPPGFCSSEQQALNQAFHYIRSGEIEDFPFPQFIAHFNNE